MCSAFAWDVMDAAWCLRTSPSLPDSPKLEVGFSRGNQGSFISPERWREKQAPASPTFGDPKSFWR